MAEDCPECMAASAIMRSVADALSGTAGRVVGGALGGLGVLGRDPANVYRGQLAGAAVAPALIESAALKVADKVKRKRSAKSKRSSKMLSKNLKKINGKARKKNGELKKGWTQARIMREAHKLCKKEDH